MTVGNPCCPRGLVLKVIILAVASTRCYVFALDKLASLHVHLEVRDPIGKYTLPEEKEMIRKWKLEWRDAENFPAVTFTDAQQLELSGPGILGDSSPNELEPSSAGRRSRRKKRHAAYYHENQYSPDSSSQQNWRKEYRLLSDNERSKFHRAVNQLRKTFPDSNVKRSYYDMFVEMHRITMAPGAHGGPAFLPWHREFLWRFEQALRKIDPDVSLPFWDSSLDQGLPNPRDSILFTEAYLGEPEGVLTTGAFANWSIIEPCQEMGTKLARNVTTNPVWGHDMLFSDADIDYILAKKKLEEIVSPFDYKFEDDHSAVHLFVGGHMSHPECAPSDPIFWLHHAFIDCTWEKFRNVSQVTDPEHEFPIVTNESLADPNHNPYVHMQPFCPIYNQHGLSSHYTLYYYKCAPREIDCSSDYDCHSHLLWCDKEKKRCRSKVKIGGNCQGLPSVACYRNSECKDDVCVQPPRYFNFYNRKGSGNRPWYRNW